MTRNIHPRTASLDRTTNACESFHSRFNSSFYKPHPDLFTFIERLKEFQTDTYVQIQGLHIENKIRNSYLKNKSHVESLIAEYEQGAISRLRFIQRSGYYQSPNNWWLPSCSTHGCADLIHLCAVHTFTDLQFHFFMCAIYNFNI